MESKYEFPKLSLRTPVAYLAVAASNESSFDGLVSTSNHLLPEEEIVWIKTSKPIWWSAELKRLT
jgi:hypothetical protein